MPNWTQLPHSVLVNIAGRIKLYEDFVDFREVCTSWRLAAVDENFRFISNQTPWLILPSIPGSDLRSFYNLSRDTPSQISLPEANGQKCLTSKGWLMIVSEDWSINLKFVLSSSPLTSNYTLMVIHGGTRKLAYFRPGFTTWKTLHHSRAAHFDVIYYEGKFYAINCVGEIIAYDIKGDDEVAINKVANFSDTVSYFEQLYLVESAKKLLVVSRIRLVIQEEEEEEASAGGSYLFRVFEVVIGRESYSRIEEVESLGNRALFLGSNSSFSVEASKDFECKPNCIYFTDDFPEYYYSKPDGGGKDMGIYNLEDGSIEKHYKGNSCCFITPPIWVEKSF